MEFAFNTTAFLVGAVGAFAHEALRWVGFRTQHRLPAYLRKIHYWVLTALLVVIGGLLAAVMAPTTISQALFLGIAAPSLLSRIGATIPKEKHLSSDDSEGSIQDFLRG